MKPNRSILSPIRPTKSSEKSLVCYLVFVIQGLRGCFLSGEGISRNTRQTWQLCSKVCAWDNILVISFKSCKFQILDSSGSVHIFLRRLLSPSFYAFLSLSVHASIPPPVLSLPNSSSTCFPYFRLFVLSSLLPCLTSCLSPFIAVSFLPACLPVLFIYSSIYVFVYFILIVRLADHETKGDEEVVPKEQPVMSRPVM